MVAVVIAFAAKMITLALATLRKTQSEQYAGRGGSLRQGQCYTMLAVGRSHFVSPCSV